MLDAVRLASVCALAGVKADVVPLQRAGSAVVPVPGADASEAATRLSRALGRADVLALHHIDGQVQAQRWRRGAVRETPAPGLVMASVPDVVERLLLSGRDPSSEPGAASSVGMQPGAAAQTAFGATQGFQRWNRVSTVVLLVVVWTAARLVRARP